ncbi:MAG: ATP-binding cassette domain-containing protein [Myxococcota bacterium]|jgi:ABC-type multidrug transport system ATPase subunit|nr:ATP-binding cassette domain-containing protein [Myxococcota bacterium]
MVTHPTSGEITFGRAEDNTHVIDHPMVSGHHARVMVAGSGKGYILEDLGSSNGTFIDGEKVVGRREIKVGETFQIGPLRLKFEPGGALKKDDLRLTTRFDVQGICYDVPGKPVRLLRDVSFTIMPGEFVALMGPAGAGKTTLMENMNGNMTPTVGRVLVNGIDLHRNFDAMRGHIGYVPQDDIVHRKLTVYEACFYTAKMRMKELADQDIHDRVVKVLQELDIAHRANTIIGGPEARVLSGGQRKRVNLAMELVTDPAILFLDEPTSGLSSSDAKSVMQVLKELSRKGRTIIITIHQPAKEVYELMDNALILGVGGRLIYYGSVVDAYRRFRTKADPDSLFEALTPKGLKEADWERMRQEYSTTGWYKEFVYNRSVAQPEKASASVKARASRAPGIGQFLLLFERMTKLYVRDVGWLIGAVVGAPLALFGFAQFLDSIPNRHSLLFFATILIYFFGIFPAIEMVVSEKTIFERERMVNLKIPSYVMSKMVFLACFGLFQAFTLAAVVCWNVRADAPFHGVFALFFSIQLAGAAAGLFFSTLAKSSKVALLLMLGWVVLMIGMSGFLLKLTDLQADWVLGVSAMRWGMGGLMAVVDDVPRLKLEFFGFGNEVWQLDVIVNFALALLPTAASMFLLRARDRV